MLINVFCTDGDVAIVSGGQTFAIDTAVKIMIRERRNKRLSTVEARNPTLPILEVVVPRIKLNSERVGDLRKDSAQ